jgi:FKBP-type peptidyl-prolyl cis-trans isomerase
MIRKYSKIFAVLAITFGALVSSCEEKSYQTIEELDNENISEYIAKNNLTVHRYKNTGLYYQILKQGTGAELRFDRGYPIVFSIKSLDGTYQALDTLNSSNRYIDFLGYFPFGSAQAGQPNSPVERQDDLKYVIKEILQNGNGQIRILVPSHLTAWGRNGNRFLGIPPNASMDYTISIYDDLEAYEDQVIQGSIQKSGQSLTEYTKTADGIYYKILSQGTGDAITGTSTVKAKYTLKNQAGTVIETNSEGIEFNLGGGVITAWTKIIPMINKGGKIRFYTPSRYAYGPNGNDNVGPFFSLDFEVEIIN